MIFSLATQTPYEQRGQPQAGLLDLAGDRPVKRPQMMWDCAAMHRGVRGRLLLPGF